MTQFIDYACYDYTLNETETLDKILQALRLGANSFSVLPFSLNTLKSLEGRVSAHIPVSCSLDIPYGLADAKSRIFMANQITKSTAHIKYIDLMMPTKMIVNRKYDKFRDEIKGMIEVCAPNNISVRYILEYRTISHEVLKKVCEVLREFNLDTVFSSSGMLIDDISDNLIACNYLSLKSNIKTICTGNIYTEKQAKLVKNTPNIAGIRFFHLNGIELFNKIPV